MAGHSHGHGQAQPAPQPKPLTDSQRKLTSIVIDILFGTMIAYLVYLYCGFRFPYMQSHQWLGVEDSEGIGRIAHTLFAMILAVVSREISQPVADMMKTAFDHMTARVPWSQTTPAAGGQ